MTTLEFDIASTAGGPRVRTIKFTPERMDQIRNLVDRGTGREEIASIIGCTVGSLQVTCSKAGISLRKIRCQAESKQRPMITMANGHASPSPPALSSPPPAPPAEEPSLLALRVTFGSQTRDIPLRIPMSTFAALAIAAEFYGIRLGELISRILISAAQAEVDA